MRITTIGVFQDRLKSEMIINELIAGGIGSTEISCLYIDRDGDMKDTQTTKKVESGTAKGATAGAVVGVIAGLAVANGVLPGIGTIFVAGPLLSVLGVTGTAAAAGAAAGIVAGGIVGSLVSLGISAEDAKIYEENLYKGNVVIVTRTQASTAKDVLQKNGASQVREYIEN